MRSLPKILRIWLAGLIILCIGASFVQAQKPQGTITIYTSTRRDLISKMVQDFESRYPEVKVNVYRSGTGEVIAKFQAELAAGAVQADLISATDKPFFGYLEKEKALLQYIPPNAAYIPDEFRYEGGRYYERKLITVAIGYNTLSVKEKPTGWSDLLNPKYKNRIGIPNPVYSGVALTTLGTLVKNPDFGWDFYRKLKANGCQIIRGNPAAARAVASGEWFLGVVAYGDLLSLKMKGSPIDFVFPEEGSPLIPQPVGILKSSQNLPAAKVFLNYLLSADALAIIAETGGYLTTRYVIRPSGISSAEEVKVIPTDWEYIRTHKEELLEKFKEIFGKL